MPLSSIDIVFRKPAAVSDLPVNGGRMTANLIASGVKNALFPDVRNAERVSGSSKWRKAFVHFAPADNSLALDVKLIAWAPTSADDRILIRIGTHTDTQAEMLATPPRPYGAASVTGALSAGTSTIATLPEDVTDGIFVANDIIYVSDKISISAIDGNEEYAEIDSVSTVGNITTLTLKAPLQYGYTAPRVSSVLAMGDVLATAFGKSVSSIAGSFDEAQLTLAPRSAVADTFTLTFTSPTAFNATGAAAGTLGSGTIGSTFSPTNSPFSGPYFTLPATAWSGAFLAGESVSFTTAPAAVPVWYQRIVPAGASSFAANSFSLAVDCESA